MEWVEVRGETLDAAKEEALDQLGVAKDDAEFEIVQEAESRWMGLKKTEARVRARVRPTQPRPKKEGGRGPRRSRGRSGEGRSGSGGRDRQGNGRSRQGSGDRGGNNEKGGGGSGRGRGNRGGGQQGGGSRDGQQRGGQQRGQQNKRQSTQSEGQPREGAETSGFQVSRRSGSDSGPRGKESGDGRGRHAGRTVPGNTKEKTVNDSGQATTEVVPLEEQHATATGFLEGVVAGFGLEGTVSMSALEEDTMLASVEGDDLGLMVGPRGGTLHALQELSRAAMQRMSDGRDTSRLMVDVAGYRERRREALAAFVAEQAVKVRDDGAELALEPMSSADRKAVHDAVMDLDGIKSISEGEDPHRRVVLLPDS